jgi:hypothetical protein
MEVEIVTSKYEELCDVAKTASRDWNVPRVVSTMHSPSRQSPGSYGVASVRDGTLPEAADAQATVGWKPKTSEGHPDLCDAARTLGRRPEAISDSG